MAGRLPMLLVAASFGVVLLLAPGAWANDPWDDCDAGEIHDSWWQDGGLTWPDTVTAGVFVELFTPSEYPFHYTRVCTKWCSQTGDAVLSYDVVIFDDNGATGPGGEPGPGTLLARIPAVATGVPNPGVQTCGYFDYEWFGADITGALEINEGSVFIGVEIDGSQEQGFYLGVDKSADLPQWIGWNSPDGGIGWNFNGFIDNYKALMIRAQALEDDPSLVFSDGFEDGTTGAWSAL
jgi:hypothetical protein